MSFELIADLTRWTARISMLIFSISFIYEAVRNGHNRVKYLWRAFVAAHLLHMVCVASYFMIIQQAPSADPLTAILIFGLAMIIWIAFKSLKQAVSKGRLFAPWFASWSLALIFTATPISRILPAETNHPIYHFMLYAMLAVLALRIFLDVKTKFGKQPT